MKVIAYSQIGEGKKECQDKILVGDTILSEGYYEHSIETFPTVIAVADGVGGTFGGELAAFKAVDGVRTLNRFSLLEKGDILGVLEKVNRQIVEFGDTFLEYENMATTLTGIYFKLGGQILFHVGNTRAYIFSGDYLIQSTRDHTAVQEAKDMKQLLEDVKSNVITACMGDGDELAMRGYLTVEDLEVYLDSGNMLMLTSDGIHDYVSDEEINALYKQAREREEMTGKRLKEMIELASTMGYTPEIQNSIEEICEYKWEKDFIFGLTKSARDNGSEDDISVVLVYE